jgi:hypothetical protein
MPFPQTADPELALSGAQQRTLLILAEGATQREAAKQVGVDERTLRRWLRDPAYADALQATRRAIWLDVTNRVHNAALDSVQVLQDLLSDKDPNARLRAARTLLAWIPRLIRLEQDLLKPQASTGHNGPDSDPPPNQNRDHHGATAGPSPPIRPSGPADARPKQNRDREGANAATLTTRRASSASTPPAVGARQNRPLHQAGPLASPSTRTSGTAESTSGRIGEEDGLENRAKPDTHGGAAAPAPTNSKSSAAPKARSARAPQQRSAKGRRR